MVALLKLITMNLSQPLCSSRSVHSPRGAYGSVFWDSSDTDRPCCNTFSCARLPRPQSA